MKVRSRARTAWHMLPAVATAAVLMGATAVASADEFTGGNVFATSGTVDGDRRGHVVEFSPTGGHVRTLDLPVIPNGGTAYGLAFGPDGRLYLSDFSSGKVLRVEPDGTGEEFGDVTAAGGVLGESCAFGPLGRLHVAAVSELVRFDTSGATATALPLPAGLDSPNGISFLPSGRRMVADFFDGPISVDGSGRVGVSINRDLTILDVATNFVQMPFGQIAFVDSRAGDVKVFQPPGFFAASFGAGELSAPTGLTLTESGTALVTSTAGARIVEFTESDRGWTTPTVVRTFAHPDLSSPNFVAVAPHRFRATLSGVFFGDDSPVKKTKGRKVEVSVALSTGEVMLNIPNDVKTTIDAHDTLGGRFVFRGRPKKRDGDSRTRILHASLPGDSATEGRASVVVELKGREVDGRFFPRAISGTVMRSTNGVGFSGKLRGRVIR